MRLTCDINLVPLKGKSVHKVLPEAHELLSNICLVSRSDGTLREAGANGLVDPDHIRETVP